MNSRYLIGPDIVADNNICIWQNNDLVVVFFKEMPIMDNINSNKKPVIDFSKTTDLIKIEEDLVTPKNWEEAKESMLGYGMEYVQGQYHMLRILNTMLDLDLCFEELKQQLTGFVNERKAMHDFALANDPLKSPPKYEHE